MAGRAASALGFVAMTLPASPVLEFWYDFASPYCYLSAARIETLVFGAAEPKAGAVESRGRLHEHPALNHRIAVVSGVLAAECGELMRKFFRERRGAGSDE